MGMFPYKLALAASNATACDVSQVGMHPAQQCQTSFEATARLHPLYFEVLSQPSLSKPVGMAGQM
jgi:hypothetical protein